MTCLYRFCFHISESNCTVTFHETHICLNRNQRAPDAALKYYNQGKLVLMICHDKCDWSNLPPFFLAGWMQHVVAEFSKWCFENNHTSHLLWFPQTGTPRKLNKTSVKIFLDPAAMVHG